MARPHGRYRWCELSHFRTFTSALRHFLSGHRFSGPFSTAENYTTTLFFIFSRLSLAARQHYPPPPPPPPPIPPLLSWKLSFTSYLFYYLPRWDCQDFFSEKQNVDYMAEKRNISKRSQERVTHLLLQTTSRQLVII